MSLPGNGIFVVRGEMSTLMAAMRRGSRWNSTAYVDEEKDSLFKMFLDLKQILNRVEDLRLIDQNIFLTPFLEVIRTDETTGAVTSLALSAINKFLSYGLLDPTSANLAITVENIVDAVTHARFMGTDQSSDGVTLFRVIEVLHTLMRSPEGSAMTNEAVCEAMLSCFKICFEPRLNELLRRSAEQALKDMVLLLFMRLPQFSKNPQESGLLQKFQMMAASMEKEKNRHRKNREKIKNSSQTLLNNNNTNITPATEENNQNKTLTTSTNNENMDLPEKVTDLTTSLGTTSITEDESTKARDSIESNNISSTAATTSLTSQEPKVEDSTVVDNSRPQSAQSVRGDSNEYINSVGVRFTQQNSIDSTDGILSNSNLLPYGLPCIQELFSFLILLCNPLDKQNTDTMIHMGLNLLTVAFEVAADNIGKYEALLQLVKDDLCRNLFALLNIDRLSIFAADLRVCFLLFEALRDHLKFQLEAYLKKLSEIIASDNPKTPYEMRELALDNLLQLWGIPGFVTELYINYDCDLYCMDLFESLTNLLSKYVLSATNVVYNTHIISMDALISVVCNIEANCLAAKNNIIDNRVHNMSSNEMHYNTNIITNNSLLSIANVATTNSLNIHRHSRQSSELEGIIIDDGNSTIIHEEESKVENISKFINCSARMRLLSSSGTTATDRFLSCEYLREIKRKKRILSQGTELFNQKPDKGIQYLQENGILKKLLDPMEVALFLRENPALDKKMIGEYISKKKNVDLQILMKFVESFDFCGLRIDEALRIYLESFRLPGEAPLIFLVLEQFADHWHKQNNEPFANTDSAFSVAYATIMLNMDQHNSNAKRLNVPMTEEDFLKNLRGLNGGGDFDQEMLAKIFNAIKNEEIVMPAEQTGLVRENYLWKVLLKRGLGSDGVFNYVHDSSFDLEIFKMVWGSTLSAFSFMFDRSTENGYQRTLTGFIKCASILAHYNLHDDFDALVLTLCKFTTLLNSTTQQEVNLQATVSNDIIQAVNFGINIKAQAAMRTVFTLVHNYGNCLRDSWRHIMELYLQLFRIKLLPRQLMEVEDFCEPNGRVQLILEKPNQKQESGIFSSLYSYLSSEAQREPTYEEQEIIKAAKKCIRECQLDQIIQESKFLQIDSLEELLRQLLSQLKAPTAHKTIGLPYAEDIVVFWMEFLVKIVIFNRDRMIPLWSSVCDSMYLLLMGSASCGYEYLLNRCIIAMFKLAIYLMRNEELCPIVLRSMKMLLALKSNILLHISKQISIGMYELLKTSAQNIHSDQDWQIVFTLLSCVGAGAEPPDNDKNVLPVPNNSGSLIPSDTVNTNSPNQLTSNTLNPEEDSTLTDKGYISDSELLTTSKLFKTKEIPQSNSNTSSPFASSPTAENWILINKDIDLGACSRSESPPESQLSLSNGSGVLSNAPLQGNVLIYNCKLLEHSPFALFKCWDSLTFVVRNVAHITPYNFETCVRCIRTFVEASHDGGIHQRKQKGNRTFHNDKRKSNIKHRTDHSTERKNAIGADLGTVEQLGGTNQFYNAEMEDFEQRYETLSIQLLDLMYTLYTRTAQIFRWWAEEGFSVPQCSTLWAQAWCPLLQGIARLATDRRREVRTYAISCLQQRALLVHDLQTLTGAEWASCFHQILFPLLNEMLNDGQSVLQLDPLLLEESRIRTATIMSKVFLHHLTSLMDLGDAFNALWLKILDYIEKFMKIGSDMLSEQMQEILKNMLLVMHSVRVFHHKDGSLNMDLWSLSWKRISEFLPKLKSELFQDEGERNQAMLHKNAAVTSSNNKSAIEQQYPALLEDNQQQEEQQEAMSIEINKNHILDVLVTSNASTINQSDYGVKSTLRSPLLTSPIDSPRHSIILQPPFIEPVQESPIIVGQLPTNAIPIIMPHLTDNNNNNNSNSGSNISNLIRQNAMDNKAIKSFENFDNTTGINTNNISLMMEEEIRNNANSFESHLRHQVGSLALTENNLNLEHSEFFISYEVNTKPTKIFDKLLKQHYKYCSNRYNNFVENMKETEVQLFKSEADGSEIQDTTNSTNVNLYFSNNETSSLAEIENDSSNNNNSTENQGSCGKTEIITPIMKDTMLNAAAVKEHLDYLRGLHKFNSSVQKTCVTTQNDSTIKYCVADQIQPHIKI